MIPPVTPGQEEKQNMVGWKNTFNMRQVTFMNLSSAQLGTKNGSRPHLSAFRRNYSITSPRKSLDLLRKNIQSAINKDIDNVIKKYLDKFFQPAIINIQNNLGRDSISEDLIKDVCKQMLEEAKSMYSITTYSRDSSPYDYSDSEASTSDGRCGLNSPVPGKRKESDTDSETGYHKIRLLHTNDLVYRLPVKREAPKWDSERITKNTLFIMGARANKVLGYGQTRGRLYVRHPELLRYSGDQEDKEWLASNNLMPASGGKAYLMVLDDIRELIQSDDYKGNPNLQLHELKGFEVPMFLVNKIKNYMEVMRTDRKVFMSAESFEVRNHSLTSPNAALDSGPSTPSDTTQIVESQPESIKSDNNFVNIPEMSPNSNHSIISSALVHSPVQSSNLFSPGVVMSVSNTDSPKQVVNVVKDVHPNENSLSNIIGLCNDSSQSF